MQHFRRLLHIGANSNRTFVVEFSLTILFCVFPLTKQRVCLSSEECCAAVVTGELISRRWWCCCSDCSDDENVILMAISGRREKFDEEKSRSDEKSSSKFCLHTPWSCWQKKRWKWAKFSSIFSLLFAIILWFLLFLDSLLAAREWYMGASLLAGCCVGKSKGKLRVVQIHQSVWEENEEVFTSTWTSSDATQAAVGSENGSNCCAIIRSMLDSLQMSFPRFSPLLSSFSFRAQLHNENSLLCFCCC